MARRFRALTLAVAVAVAVAVAGCGGARSDSSTSAGGSNPPATADAGDGVTGSAGSSATAGQPQQEVPEQLQFTSATVDGGSFDGASLVGSAAVLWFWAPWCVKCAGEAAGVAAVAADHAGEVTFVGVAAQDEVEAMQGFVSDHELSGFTHLADPNAEVWQRFGVTLQPAYAFLSADGAIDVVTDRLSEDDLRQRVSELVG